MSRIYSESFVTLEGSVHKALSNWHKSDAFDYPLGTLKAVQKAGSVDQSDIRQATNQVLLSALNILQSSHERDALLLIKRFAENKPTFVVANELNVADSTLYKMQKQAIRRLTLILFDMEQDDSAVRLSDFDARVPIQTYDQLIGVDSQLDRLQALLLASAPPWSVVLTGLGGIGKTALAHRIYRRLILEEKAFSDFAWVSAQQQFFDPGGFVRAVDRPALTASDLTEALATQLLPASAVPRPFSMDKALRALQSVMRHSPHLVIVDNLETVSDLQTLVPLLKRLAGPSKFLLTSREALYSDPDVHHVVVPELSRSHATQLVRHEAGLRNLPDVALADEKDLIPIFDTVGGNPLALKLVVGQLRTLPLDNDRPSISSVSTGKADELYRFIYWTSWRQLSAEAQSVLLLMPLFSDSGTELITIERISDVKEYALLEALEQLIGLSLVNVSGDFKARRYGIHRLTETFLLQEVIKWTAHEDGDS